MEQAYLDQFITHLRAQDRSRHTVDGYRRNVEWFFAWLREQTGRDIPLGEVTTFDVQRYRDHLMDAGRKPATINQRIVALRAFFAWEVGAGHITASSAADVKFVRHERLAPKGLGKQRVYLLQRQAVAQRRLTEMCAEEIKRGADDELEMGVFHDLCQPQRAANLRARLDEYTPAGMGAAIIYAS